MEKLDLLNLAPGSGNQVGTQVGTQVDPRPSKSRPKPEKSDAEKQYSLDIDFRMVQASFWKGFWDAFWKKINETCKNTFLAKTFKIVVSP